MSVVECLLWPLLSSFSYENVSLYAVNSRYFGIIHIIYVGLFYLASIFVSQLSVLTYYGYSYTACRIKLV